MDQLKNVEEKSLRRVSPLTATTQKRLANMSTKGDTFKKC